MNEETQAVTTTEAPVTESAPVESKHCRYFRHFVREDANHTRRGTGWYCKANS